MPEQPETPPTTPAIADNAPSAAPGPATAGRPRGTARPSAPGQRTGLTRRPPRAPKPAPPPVIPERGEPPDYLIVGRVSGAHGLRGEFRMAVITNHPDHLRTLKQIYLGDERTPWTVRRIHPLPGGKEAIVRLNGLGDPEAAAALRGQQVQIARADAPVLPEGEYFHYQLLGLDVYDEGGKLLGRLSEIIETGANDVYLIRGPVGELLLPAIEGVILTVDPDGGRMVVRPPAYY